jgi:hypothetical protein
MQCISTIQGVAHVSNHIKYTPYAMKGHTVEHLQKTEWLPHAARSHRKQFTQLSWTGKNVCTGVNGGHIKHIL